MRPTDHLAYVAFDPETIAERVSELAAEVTRDYADKRPVVVGVLSGCLPFLADLLRKLDLQVEVDFMAVSSYRGLTESTGVVQIQKDLSTAIEGRHVLLVEDIIDTGLTLRYLLDKLSLRRAASLEVCVLLDKTKARIEPVAVRYAGFECPDDFVVGYGLDYRGLYRNLPCIGVLRPEILGD